MANIQYMEEYAFYQQLKFYYDINRGKIRSRYNDLTKKFLAYNDKDENPNAFLRKPQFEALEMYIFIKEFMDNPQVYEMFDDWRNHRNKFSDASYYSVNKNGQVGLFDEGIETVTDTLFKQMKKYKESYPNYIYALTMGLGKTILMATCIFYEFLLANKYPKDKRFCHNALVFAPDKTVLQSLREIITFDKSLVVPPEYARVLEANIHFHFLEETGKSLHTIDDSDFNIIISNTQKIIIKKKRKEPKAGEILFGEESLLSSIYGDATIGSDDVWDESSLMDNQRFKKLCRLPQLGVYVDEAHHLFGRILRNKLEQRHLLRPVYDILLICLLRKHLLLHAITIRYSLCKQTTFTEVVYAYGLKESIQNGYLKDADPIAFENVKDTEFLKIAVSKFWEKYGYNTYEGLKPKLAIYASRVEEAVNEVRPALERILVDLGIPTNSILLNVGDSKYTKHEDIRNFNNLDVCGSEGNEKQFIILVDKGKEGWNCRSLFGVAMFRNPNSKIFVLQATMRCLRQITDENHTATIFLSKENYDTLEAELNKNFNMDIKDIKNDKKSLKSIRKVRVLPPLRTIILKKIRHEYKIGKNKYSEPIDFKLSEVDYTKYESIMYEKESLASTVSTKETNIDYIRDKVKYSLFSLVGEIARYLNVSCILIERIIKESIDGEEFILDRVNNYNEIVNDIIIPNIFHALYNIDVELHTADKEIVLLKEPKGAGYYEFLAEDKLVVTNQDKTFTPEQLEKSFHADTYCFDSIPEKECFMQYIVNDRVKEVYFTGMFTANQGDLSIQYYDPESGRIRLYYPDFLAKLDNGLYQLIEVKGDNKIDDIVVKAKATAAHEMAVASGIEYKMYAGSDIMNTRILDYLDNTRKVVNYEALIQEEIPTMVAEDLAPYGTKK